MKVYSVSYDLNKPGQEYTALYDELKKSKSWWHHLDSTWLIYTSETAQQLFDRLHQHIDSNDYILIIEVKKNYRGWLPKDAWTWINNHIEDEIYNYSRKYY